MVPYQLGGLCHISLCGCHTLTSAWWVGAAVLWGVEAEVEGTVGLTVDGIVGFGVLDTGGT